MWSSKFSILLVTILLLSEGVAVARADGCGFCQGGTLRNPRAMVAVSSEDAVHTCLAWQQISSLTDSFTSDACKFIGPFFEAICGCDKSEVHEQCDLCESPNLMFKNPKKGLVIPKSNNQQVLCHTIYSGVQMGAVPSGDCQVLKGVTDFCGGCVPATTGALTFLEPPSARFEVPVEGPTSAPVIEPAIATFPDLGITPEPTLQAFVGNVASFPTFGDGLPGNIAEAATESTAKPSTGPSIAPTLAPTSAPTTAPSTGPTVASSSAPTLAPSAGPTVAHSLAPTSTPTEAPSIGPTASLSPSVGPSVTHSSGPTSTPTNEPTASPTVTSSSEPSEHPTIEMLVATNSVGASTIDPTTSPTVAQTSTPTNEPTAKASESPTVTHSSGPTSTPTNEPTASPTVTHSSGPSSAPTTKPTNNPTGNPSSSPSVKSLLREAESVSSETPWTCDLCPPSGTLEHPSKLISLIKMSDKTVTKTCGALLWDARTGRNDIDESACTFLQPFFGAVCGCSTFAPFPKTDKKETDQRDYKTCKLCKKSGHVFQDPHKGLPIPGSATTQITCGAVFAASINGAVTHSECMALATIDEYCGGCGKTNASFYGEFPRQEEQCIDCLDENESSMYIYKDFGYSGATFQKAFSAPLHCDDRKRKPNNDKKHKCTRLLYPELESCVLAPITSFDELLRVQSVIPPGKAAHTAVHKDPLVLKTEARECYTTNEYHGIKGVEVQFSRSQISSGKNCVVENWMEGLVYGYDNEYEGKPKLSKLNNSTAVADPCESMKSGWTNYKTGSNVPSSLWKTGKLNYCNIGPVQEVGAVWAVEPDGKNYGDLRDVSTNWPLPGAVYKCCKTIYNCFGDYK